MHYSAKRGLAIACCLSVSPTYLVLIRQCHRQTICDIGGSGPNRLDILETTCTDDYPNIFAFRSPKAIHLFPWEHAGILGRLEVRYWSTKATIFLNRVKVQEKLLWRDYRNSPTLFRTVPSRSPTAFYSPRLGVRNPTPKPKTPITVISGTDYAMDFKFGQNIHRVHPNKSPLKISEKRDRGRIQRLPNFWDTHYLRNG